MTCFGEYRNRIIEYNTEHNVLRPNQGWTCKSYGNMAGVRTLKKGAPAYVHICSAAVSHARPAPSASGACDTISHSRRPSLPTYPRTYVLSTGIFILRPTQTKQAPLVSLTTRKVRNWLKKLALEDGLLKRKTSEGINRSSSQNLPAKRHRAKSTLTSCPVHPHQFHC